MYKNLLEELKIGFITRVVGLDKLRTKHKTFEAKRQLLKEGELFLVDDRVTVEVGKCLGKMWRDAKKCVTSLLVLVLVPQASSPRDRALTPVPFPLSQAADPRRAPAQGPQGRA